MLNILHHQDHLVPNTTSTNAGLSTLSGVGPSTSSTISPAGAPDVAEVESEGNNAEDKSFAGGSAVSST